MPKNLTQKIFSPFLTLLTFWRRPETVSPTVAFGSILFLSALVWIVLPTLLIPNYGLDLLEMLAVGHNWVLATNKHAALTTWFGEAIYELLGRQNWAPYFASQICVVVSIVGIWRLAKRFLSESMALFAALAMLSYNYFNYESVIYNNHSTMAVFWILSVLFFRRALEGNRLRDWLLTGVMLGLGLYCKLTLFLLVFTVVVYMFLDASARRFWRSVGPYLSTASAFLIFLPLFLWMKNHDWALLRYASDRCAEGEMARSSWAWLSGPFLFILTQIPITATILFPILPLTQFAKREKEFSLADRLWRQEKGRFLSVMIFLPILLQLLICAVSGTRMRTALGCHLWYFIPIGFLWLWGVCEPSQPHEDPRFLYRLRTGARLCLLIPAGIVVFSFAATFFGPAVEGKASRYHYPGRAIACAAEDLWHSYSTEPLPFVRGEMWVASNASVYGEDYPKYWDSQWSTEETFAQQGGIWLWEPKEGNDGAIRAEIEAKYPNAQIQPLYSFRQQTPFRVANAEVFMALIPPQYP